MLTSERRELVRTIAICAVGLLLIPVALDSWDGWQQRRTSRAAASAHSLRAAAALAEGRLAEAEIAARAALDLVPRDPDARRNLMHIQAIRVARVPKMLEGRDLEGLRYTLTVLGAYDGQARDPEVFVAAGHLAAAQGDIDAALDLYRAAVTVDEGSAAAHLALGGLHRRVGHGDDAVQAYEAALAADPTSLKTANDLGVQLVDMGQLERGAKLFEQALGIEDNAASRINLGNALLGLGKLDEALEHLQQATKLAPDSAAAWGRLGAALLDAKRPGDALAALDRSLSLAPAATTVLYAARAQQALGRHDRAIQILAQLQQGTDGATVPADAPYYLALSLEAIGEKQGAASAYRQFIAAAQDAPVHRERVAKASAALATLSGSP